MSADSAGNDGERRPVAFISHHSSQVETARQLKRVLANNGVEGWMAPDDIDPGRPFDQAIIEQVRRSDLIILLFCARSDQSRHVKRELMMAENGDKLIFPVRLENIDAEGLAYWLNDYQWIDWFDRRDDSIQRMIDTIKRLVAAELARRPPEPLPAEEPPVVAPPVAPEAPADRDESDADGDPDAAPDVSPPPPPPPPPAPAPDALDQDARAEDERPSELRDEASRIKVAPIVAGEGRAGTADDDGDDASKKRMILYAALGAAALIAIILAVILWPDGDAVEDAAPGVLSSSIDCADTAIPSHAIICGDAALRERETGLSNRYEAALDYLEGGDRVALQQGHAAFLARRDECRSAACVATVYDAREGELAEFDIPQDALPEEPAEAGPEADREAETPTVPELPQMQQPPPTPDAEQPRRPTEQAPAQTDRSPPARPDPRRQSRTTPPQPIGNPGNWVRNSDYPTEILRNGEQGTSRYQVRVGANGVPTACFTIGSSGHFQLDARACNMVMSRARFRPARDASGNPTAGLYSGSHSWRAPR